MRTMLSVLAAAAVLAAAPAHATTAQQADCPLGKLPAGFDVALSDALLSQVKETAEAKITVLSDAVTACAAETGMDPDTAGQVFLYTIGRLTTPVYSARLKAANIPTEAIDKALDIGPGRANKPREEMTDPEWDAIVTELARENIDANGLEESNGVLIGAYGATAGLFYAGPDLPAR